MTEKLTFINIFRELDTAERYYKETQIEEIKTDLKSAISDAKEYSQSISRRVRPRWVYQKEDK